jgi:hypothetical protein
LLKSQLMTSPSLALSRWIAEPANPPRRAAQASKPQFAIVQPPLAWAALMRPPANTKPSPGPCPRTAQPLFPAQSMSPWRKVTRPSAHNVTPFLPTIVPPSV